MDFFCSVKKLLGFEEGPHFSKAEISRHDTRESLWIIADKTVYDATQFIDQHAGGAQSILKRGGGVTDCSRDLGFHSSKAQNLWKTFQIGFVASDGKTDEEGRNYLRSRGFIPVEDLPKKGCGMNSKNGSFDNVNNNSSATVAKNTSSNNNNSNSTSSKAALKCTGKHCTFHFEENNRNSNDDGEGGCINCNNTTIGSNAGKAPK